MKTVCAQKCEKEARASLSIFASPMWKLPDPRPCISKVNESIATVVLIIWVMIIIRIIIIIYHWYCYFCHSHFRKKTLLAAFFVCVFLRNTFNCNSQAEESAVQKQIKGIGRLFGVRSSSYGVGSRSFVARTLIRCPSGFYFGYYLLEVSWYRPIAVACGKLGKL